MSGDNFYDLNEYCVQDIKDSEEISEFEWALFVCKGPHVEEDVDIISKRPIIPLCSEKVHYSTILVAGISVMLLAVIVFFYNYFKDLRTVHGKSVVFFDFGNNDIAFDFSNYSNKTSNFTYS